MKGHFTQRVCLPGQKQMVASGRQVTIFDYSCTHALHIFDFVVHGTPDQDDHLSHVTPLVAAADCGHCVIVAEHREDMIQFWDLNTMNGSMEAFDIVDERGNYFESIVALAIDDCGNLFISCADGLYVVTLPWLAARYSPWMKLCWKPTKTSYRRLSAEAKETTWTVLLCSLRGGRLSFMPIELWYYVLSCVGVHDHFLYS